MASIQAKMLKEKIEETISQFKKDIQETIEEFKSTKEEFQGMSNQEVEAFVVESFGLLYDELDNQFKFPAMVDLAAKEMVIKEGVDMLFDKYVEKD